MTKAAWYYNTNRNIDQWNKVGDSEINAHTYDHLISNKGARDIC
jgi:hypothetical protein